MIRKHSTLLRALLFVSLFVPAAAKPEWRLMERYADLEIYYETNSIKKFSDQIFFTTLTNFFVKKRSGDEQYKSVKAERSINCVKEEVALYSFTQYADYFASGEVILSSSVTPIVDKVRPKTIAGVLMNIICKLET